ncbi:MAG: hypothetical protein F4Z34_10615 [Acidimicrobiaceae bacterium]|nr:hypothetical protein [Acidimicrobiaceae bacterium]
MSEVAVIVSASSAVLGVLLVVARMIFARFDKLATEVVSIRERLAAIENDMDWIKRLWGRAPEST